MAAGPTRLAVLVLLILAVGAADRLRGQGDARRAPAKRIVSLVPSLTEILFAIGAGPAVVGVDSFSSYPPAIERLPRVGALVDPDVERILSLRPDLVVTYGSQNVLETQLTRASVRTYSYRHGGVDRVLESIHELGRITGRSQEADRLVAQITGRLDGIRARVKGRPRPRTLLVIDRQPGTLREIYASGGVGFLQDMLTAAGGENVFADVQTESVQPSTETVLARAPQVILEVRAEGLIYPAAVASERNVWTVLTAVPAVRSGRIHFLSGSHLVVPGPRLTQGAEDFARVLHPQVFAAAAVAPAR